MSTYQDVLDLARVPLNDVDKVRFTDVDLQRYAVHGMQQVVKRRPDLFVGKFATLPTITDTVLDTFPINDIWIQTLADFVTARASSVDDEHVNNGRVALFAALFGGDVPV
ncbi:hypothetical protein KAR91_03140 [Candidatus Pacearchaeota archaeon]|nr:hypothetical protein [Candidatus Pacearchaeota archaeon]